MSHRHDKLSNGTAYLGTRGYRKARLITKEDFAELLDDAPNITYDYVMLFDAVHSAIRKDDGKPIFIVTEVSVKLRVDEVTRTNRRAAALSSFIGKECVGLAAGAFIDPAAVGVARENGVQVIVPQEWAEQAA